MGKILVVTGLLVAGIGLLVMLGVPLGRLPGDVVYRRGSPATFYLPIATSALLSIVLTLLVTFMRR